MAAIPAAAAAAYQSIANIGSGAATAARPGRRKIRSVARSSPATSRRFIAASVEAVQQTWSAAHQPT